MFPLNSVVFPGLAVPLVVFEDRYRALVRHLLRIENPAERHFGTVSIREGYEVGDGTQHLGMQSMFRVGCRMQVTDVEANLDGTFHLETVAIDRIRLDELDTSGSFPVGHVTDYPDATAQVSPDISEMATATFAAYRQVLSEIHSDPYHGALPQDPTYLSWTLAACAPLPMGERQALLEAEDAGERLGLVTRLLRAELKAMNVIPSLPATDVARTRWSPN